jgi:hypothetical protein
MSAPSFARLHRPPPTLAAWAAYFRTAPVPVLRDTAAQIEAWREAEDQLDAHTLADVLGPDPLMTLKLLAHVATTARRETDVETVTAALVLMGIGPFFRTFDALPVLEDALADMPDALAGAQRVLQRSRRAARFALGFPPTGSTRTPKSSTSRHCCTTSLSCCCGATRPRWCCRSRSVSAAIRHCAQPWRNARCSASNWASYSKRS